MKKTLLFSFILATLVGCSKTETAQINNPILTVEGGQIQGVAGEKPGVMVYKGIPYAAPPIKENRWKAPQPVIPWEGVRQCNKFGHPPFQFVHYPGGYTTEWGYGDESPYSEDCLYLNVYTKAPGQLDKKMPVAVWIFGGGLREGWGSEPEFYGEEWADKDVVLITFNYRVNVFGFFTHPELTAESPNNVSGNYGTLDQIQVLKWVKENITQFGGDPDNVMIFGQSAGARSTKTLCASPLTKGLFNKAVIMSGSGLVLPEKEANRMPTLAGGQMTLAEEEVMVKEAMDWAGLTDLQKMRAASTETIFSLGTIYKAVTGKYSPLIAAPVWPTIDGYVLPEGFDAACLDNSLAHVDYMIGYTMHDMGRMGEEIADFCLNREQVGDKAWAYQFARPLPYDDSHPEVTSQLKGAFHSSDLWFVFKSLKNCWRPWTQGDWDLSEKMLTAWTNFAKYSNPNGPDGGEWAPYTKENPKFMVFQLDEKDAEASFVGEPIVAARPQ